MLNTIGERIQFIRKQLKLNQQEFSELICVSRAIIQKYEQDLVVPTGKSLMNIKEKTGYSPTWILFGEDEKASKSSQSQSFNSSNTADIIQIPLVSAVLSAGGGSFETEGTVEKYLSFRRDFLDRKGKIGSMVLMRVSGDSMEPDIQDNDVVLIDQSQTGVLAGKIYAVAFCDTIYLKRINMLPDKMLLESSNKYYGSIVINSADFDQVRIIGKVVWWCREVL